MNNCPGQRGQVVQVGAVILLGFVVLSIAIFQAQGVPQETIETEVEHNQQVADQLEALSVALAETTATGTPQATDLPLGTAYNGRPLFVYPPPTAGTLETTDSATVHIENATAADESASFNNYWDTTTRSYTTRGIQYHIGYQELQETPNYTFEYGLAVAEFEETTQIRSPVDQPLIDSSGDETEISLVTYDGELTKRSPATETIVVERVTESTTVAVEADSSTEPITLRLPTALDNDTWNKTLRPDEQPAIEAWSHEADTVSIEFDPEADYALTVHKIDVGPNAMQPEPTYLREVGKETDEITVDVRTEYNDPVDETVAAWVFAENETVTPEDTVQIPPGEFTYETAALDESCLTIERDVEHATSAETLDIDGGCP